VKRSVVVVAEDAARKVVAVRARDIVAGDWMRDRGEMKEVADVEPVIDGQALSASRTREPGPSAYIVKFTTSETGEFHLYVPADVSVSVWRARS
jgi:hypothetical protein